MPKYFHKWPLQRCSTAAVNNGLLQKFPQPPSNWPVSQQSLKDSPADIDLLRLAGSWCSTVNIVTVEDQHQQSKVTKCPVCVIIIFRKIRIWKQPDFWLRLKNLSKSAPNYTKEFRQQKCPMIAEFSIHSGENKMHKSNELFKMCETENISLHQLSLLGYKQTFANWRA